MATKYLKGNEDFGAEHFPSDFGFSGSAQKVKPTRHRAPPAPEHNPISTQEHGEGHGGGEPDAQSNFAHGGHMPHIHPHGHHPVHMEPHEHGHLVHHAHGGMTLHHHDGSISHYDHGGEHLAHHAHGTHHEGHHGHMQDESTHVGKMQREKKMIAKGIHEHEDHEHGGEHTDIELRRGGGMPVPHARLPRGMKPPGMRPHSPVGAPKKQKGMSTPFARNPSPPGAGAMDLGVEPSAEPDIAGSDQSDLGGALSHGGSPRRRRHHED